MGTVGIIYIVTVSLWERVFTNVKVVLVNWGYFIIVENRIAKRTAKKYTRLVEYGSLRPVLQFKVS